MPSATLLIARGENTAERPGGRRIELVTSGQRYFIRHSKSSTLRLRGVINMGRGMHWQMLQTRSSIARTTRFWFVAAVQSYNHRKGTLHLQNGKEVPIAVRKRDSVWWN